MTLQNKLCDVLVRSRLHPVILCTALGNSFYKLVFERAEETVLDFIGLKHWLKLLINDKVEIYRFARLVFGLMQLTFILKGTLDVHFDNYGQQFREVVEKVRDMYVDDLVTWGESINEVKKLKSDSITLFR